jgi:general secretion pathway protein K
LAAGLAAIALTIANTVRGETERSSTDADGLKAYYLAAGGIDRMLLYLEKADSFRGADRRAVVQPITRMVLLNFPSGVVKGEIIPETSKLDVNKVSPKDLLNLLLAMGLEPDRAEQIQAGILDWRGSGRNGAVTAFDQYYLSLTPSFVSRHASLQEIEELLLVRGISPDLFYGSEIRDAQGQLVPHAGLRDCLSVFGSEGLLDVNTVEPAVMMSVGIPPDRAAAIYNLRKAAPIRSMREIGSLRGPGTGRLGMENIVYGKPMAITLRATAQLRLPNGQLSDVRRTVSEMVMLLAMESQLVKPGEPLYHVMRWYENTVPLQ